tara:strand:- start:437 stop:664 length:228 start_codon:yes stop_codon:yes gene_type:complete
MKTKKDIEKGLGLLSQDDIDKVRNIRTEIQAVVNAKKIDEKGLRRLENCLRELENLTHSYNWRFIKLLKQDHMID